MSNATLNIVIV